MPKLSIGWHMDNLGVAILAAGFSTLGSLLLQMYISKNSKDQRYDEKRLMALLDVRQKVEQAGGQWYGWTNARLSGLSDEECSSLENAAGSATNDAWYATRVFEMYFPTLMKESQQMRDSLLSNKAEAVRQVELGGDFDKVRIDAGWDALRNPSNLSEVVSKARKILGYPLK